MSESAPSFWKVNVGLVVGLGVHIDEVPIELENSMTAEAPTPEQIGRLQAALDARSTEKSRTFWSKYLKGDATFRGVPMAGVREVVHAWWEVEALGELTVAAQTRVALRLFEEKPTEDKLAGVLALSELLLPHLSKKNLSAFARLFTKGYITDWNLCDWFCVKVLGKMLEQAEEPLDLAETISTWRVAKPLWQRRAACVAFVNHARHGDTRIPGLSAVILRNADALVRDPERFAQTGVGWVLRELSLADRKIVAAFAEEHAGRLSAEGVKYIVEKMPAGEKKRLLARHKKHSGRHKSKMEPARSISNSGRLTSLKRPCQPMPGFVSEALQTSGLMDAYLQRPPYRQNDYLGWINQAKRQQTKNKRLQQMLDELEAGDCYMSMDWRGPAARVRKR